MGTVGLLGWTCEPTYSACWSKSVTTDTNGEHSYVAAALVFGGIVKHR